MWYFFLVTHPNEFEIDEIKQEEEEEEEIEYYMEIAPNESEADILAGVEPVSYLWTHEATACLIEQYRKFRALVGQTTRIRSLREMFEIISAEMRKRNFFFSSQKCENKWRVLERKYKQLVYREMLKKPGRIKDFYNWKHKEAMDDIFKNNLQQSSFDPKILEVAAASAAKGTEQNHTTDSRKLGENAEEEESLAEILKDGLEEIKKRLDEAELNKERRHRDKMALRKSELDIQKKLLSLKAKKLEIERTKILAMAKQLEIPELKF